MQIIIFGFYVKLEKLCELNENFYSVHTVLITLIKLHDLGGEAGNEIPQVLGLYSLVVHK